MAKKKVKKANSTLYIRVFKRMFDLVFSSLLLIFLLPVIVIIALMVKMLLGSPVLFKQKRPGLKEEIFTLHKFRTMTDEKDAEGNLLPTKQRVTPFGLFLRSTSLDELPELFNILRGDMSFVGPRPLSVKYLPYYSDWERQRHNIRPGLTGLAQVNGRNISDWETRFHYDIEYLHNLSLLLDIKIVLKTAVQVVKRSGIGNPGEQRPESLHRIRRRNGTKPV